MSLLFRILPVLLVLQVAAAEANLLSNGDLVLAGTTPTGWKGGAFTAETTGLPKDITSAITTKIVAVAGNAHGQTTQRIAVAKPNARYRVATWCKATVPQCAYLQVKLYGPDKAELKRLTVGHSGTEWAKVEGVVDATGASAIEVLLRWRSEARFDGASVCFANATLSETADPATVK